jgi:hypothetical protein
MYEVRTCTIRSTQEQESTVNDECAQIVVSYFMLTILLLHEYYNSDSSALYT